jgi:hypothetical protein
MKRYKDFMKEGFDFEKGNPAEYREYYRKMNGNLNLLFNYINMKCKGRLEKDNVSYHSSKEEFSFMFSIELEKDLMNGVILKIKWNN